MSFSFPAPDTLAGGISPPALPANTLTKEPDMQITIQSTLAGAKFRPQAARATLLELGIGDMLRLEPEPENPYDPRAVKVISPLDTLPEHLGYIARADNPAVFAALQAGTTIECKIIAFASALAPVLELTWDE